MNIKVDGIGFQGEKEILYGLVRAAQNAKTFEYYNQPAIAARLSTNKQLFQMELNASMKAYLDMALRDEAFEKTIKEIKPSQLRYLQKMLQPEQTEHSLVKPMDKFKSVVQNVIYNMDKAKDSLRETMSELYEKLEL